MQTVYEGDGEEREAAQGRGDTGGARAGLQRWSLLRGPGCRVALAEFFVRAPLRSFCPKPHCELNFMNAAGSEEIAGSYNFEALKTTVPEALDSTDNASICGFYRLELHAVDACSAGAQYRIEEFGQDGHRVHVLCAITPVLTQSRKLTHKTRHSSGKLKSSTPQLIINL